MLPLCTFFLLSPYILVLKSAKKKTSAKNLGCAYHYLAEK